MTYQTGSIIAASDYNNLIGDSGSLSPFSSSASAERKLAAIYGVGYANRGFGQSKYVLQPKSPSSVVSTVEWSDLVNAMYTVAFYTGAINNLPTNDWINAKIISEVIESTPTEFESPTWVFDDFLFNYDSFDIQTKHITRYNLEGEMNNPQEPNPNLNDWYEAEISTLTSELNIPTVDQFKVGSIITPLESSAPTNSPYDLDNNLSIIDATRLNQAEGVKSVTYNFFTEKSTIAPAPGFDFSTSISFDFGSTDAARFFFNSGGELRFRMIHSSTATLHDQFWANALVKFGVVRFNSFNTQRSSTSILSVNNTDIGYYNLPLVDTLICSTSDIIVPGLELYGMNNLQIFAKTSGTFENGGNGSLLTFTFNLIDDYSGPDDTFSPGLMLVVDLVKAADYLVIQSPTPILNSGWSEV